MLNFPQIRAQVHDIKQKEARESRIAIESNDNKYDDDDNNNNKKDNRNGDDNQ